MELFFAAYAPDLTAQTPFDPRLHLALEGRANYTHEDSRARAAAGASLYDFGATVRPMVSLQRGPHRFSAELEQISTIGDSVAFGNSGAITPSGAAADDTLFDLSTVWSSGERHRHLARLDRLTWAWQPDWGTLTVGRHAVTWGGGLVFNPFDLFNPFAPGDVIRDFKVGADMVHVDVPLTDGGVQLLAVGRRDPMTGDATAEASSFAALWQRRIADHEINLLGAWHHDEPVLGLGVSGLWGEAIWRVDATWQRVRPPNGLPAEETFAAMANLQYSWMWAGKNVFGLVELHHQNSGHADARVSLLDPVWLTQFARRNVFLPGRNHAAASLQIEMHPLVNLFGSIIVNLDDGSALLQPRVTWSVTQRLQVLAGGDVPVGGRGTEFGGFDPGDPLGTTRSPFSLYVRATWDW